MQYQLLSLLEHLTANKGTEKSVKFFILLYHHYRLTHRTSTAEHKKITRAVIATVKVSASHYDN